MAALDFSRRATTLELMDTEDCDFDTFRGCLADLERVNRLTLLYRPTLSFLDRLVHSGRLRSGRPLRIVDVGSGHGDMLRKIAIWAKRRRLAVELTGIDLNAWSTRAAQEATPPDLPIRWLTMNVLDYQADSGVDLVLSSQFTHHLDDPSLVRFLAWMEQSAGLGWFISDLHRHRLPYTVFSRVSRAMRFHRFVQNDGPISITRSFVTEDWKRLVEAAGIPLSAVQVEWWMPFRLCVSRVRTP